MSRVGALQRMRKRALWMLVGSGATLGLIAVGIRYGAFEPIHYP